MKRAVILTACSLAVPGAVHAQDAPAVAALVGVGGAHAQTSSGPKRAPAKPATTYDTPAQTKAKKRAR